MRDNDDSRRELWPPFFFFSLYNAQSCFARDILSIIDFISISYMTTAHLPVITWLINELRE